MRCSVNSKPKVLQRYLAQSIKSGQPLPHLLLVGGSAADGLTVATTLARQLKVTLKTISSETAGRPGRLSESLISLKRRGILFVSNIENLSAMSEEILRSAIEQSYVAIKIEEWGVVRDKEVGLIPFTVIASTPRESAVSGVLNKYFTIRLHLSSDLK